MVGSTTEQAQSALSYNNLNQNTAFSFDERGNQLTASGAAYTWDAADRMTRFAGGLIRADYAYDASGRRTEKRVFTIADDETGAETLDQGRSRRFAWDGQKIEAEFDLGNHLLITYAWSPAGGLLAVTDHRGTIPITYRVIQDATGSVVGLIAPDGSIAATYRYDPYGRQLEASGPAADVCGYRFAGGYWDEESRLQDHCRRYYSPEFGRWLSRDPIAEAGGVNVYAYCGGDPVNRKDPGGLYYIYLAGNRVITNLHSEGIGTLVPGTDIVRLNVNHGYQGAIPQFIEEELPSLNGRYIRWADLQTIYNRPKPELSEGPWVDPTEVPGDPAFDAAKAAAKAKADEEASRPQLHDYYHGLNAHQAGVVKYWVNENDSKTAEEYKLLFLKDNATNEAISKMSWDQYLFYVIGPGEHAGIVNVWGAINTIGGACLIAKAPTPQRSGPYKPEIRLVESIEISSKPGALPDAYVSEMNTSSAKIELWESVRTNLSPNRINGRFRTWEGARNMDTGAAPIVGPSGASRSLNIAIPLQRPPVYGRDYTQCGAPLAASQARGSSPTSSIMVTGGGIYYDGSTWIFMPTCDNCVVTNMTNSFIVAKQPYWSLTPKVRTPLPDVFQVFLRDQHGR